MAAHITNHSAPIGAPEPSPTAPIPMAKPRISRPVAWLLLLAGVAAAFALIVYVVVPVLVWALHVLVLGALFGIAVVVGLVIVVLIGLYLLFSG